MKVIKSNTVTPTTLTATDVPENDAPEWVTSTNYHVGDQVMVTTTANGAATATHKIYVSVHSQSGNDPTIDDGTNWTEVSSTNRFKMFNDVVQEQTTQANIIDVTITPAVVTTALAAINVDCASITVTVTDPLEGIVYDETFQMTSFSGITNWYDFFFTPINRKKELSVLGLPPYAAASIDVTFNDSGETAKVGALVLGTSQNIGDSQYGASFGIIDYSTKLVDAQGRTTVIAGTYSDEADIDVVIETGRFAEVKKILTDLRTTPSVWIAEDNTEGTIIYGYYREFDVLLTGPVVSMCTLSIEGLT
jgi:hypothetical protein